MSETCDCGRQHFPLQFFTKGNHRLATRGVKPVENVLAEGWERLDKPLPQTVRALTEAYNRSHRFDWLHTPTYLDDRETHLMLKAQTARPR